MYLYSVFFFFFFIEELCTLCTFLWTFDLRNKYIDKTKQISQLGLEKRTNV